MIEIPPEHVAGFAVIRDLGVSGIDALTRALPGVLLRTSELEQAIEASGIGDSASVAHLVLMLSSSLRWRSTSVLLDQVRDSLRETASWSDDQLAEWDAARPSLEALLDSPGLLTLAKAIRLQYDHTNILTETHVVTDVRPIFNRDASEALAVITCHTLRLGFQSEGQPRNLTLALDTPDLERLIQDAQRALKKAQVMKGYFSAPAILPNRIAGGDER